MKKVLITGVSVIDFIFQIDAIPNNFEKYRANNASISGGGVAANAAVAIAKLNGKPSLCLLYTSPSPRDLSTSRMPSSA